MLERETGGLTWAAPTKKIREELDNRKPVVPAEDAWRVPYLGKLLEERDRLVYQGEEDSKQVERLQSLMDSLCSN